MERLEFEGHTVVVTGGSQGIGAAVAEAFAAVGAKIVVHYRSNKEAADSVVSRISAAGGTAVALSARLDVGSEVDAFFAAVRDAYGATTILINNAGAFPNSALLDMTEDEWRRMYADNMDSMFLCTKTAGLGMKQAGGGVIINMASISAEIPGPDHAHYNSAKAAAVMFTRSAAQELGPHNIRVNAVSPGVVFRSDIEELWPEGVARFCAAAPLGCLVQPEDVANACVFLASDKAARITGVNLPVDAGVLSAKIY
ncbi:MAG: SDR family oxidoreductase [Woeseia sp.]|jgi:NAD(P)-dependent dehydrogenase (short-subunit alcohol dehydrogenase family)|nr:SDR family oxidoreductase [Woeseia sp.]MBT6211868.1 SDR family oxidoreductase [Woeseia sp.]